MSPQILEYLTGAVIGILIFFVVMFWFFKSLSKAKGKYMI